MKDRAEKLCHLLVTRLRPKHFALLRSIDQHRTLSRVAFAMHVSQPTITKALKDIEDIFMTRLFDRTPRGLKATTAGEVVLRYATTALADLKTTAQTLAAIETGFEANIRMGVIPHAPDALWAPALTQLLQQEMRISVAVQEGVTEDLVHALQTNALDCAIGRSLLQKSDGDIVQEPIYQQPPCLLVNARNHERLSAGALDWGSLSRLDWILQPLHTPTRQAIDSIFACAGVPLPAPLVETFSLKVIETVFRAQPDAIAILARDMGDRLIAGGVCRMLPQKLEWNLPPICILTKRSAAQRPALQALVAAIRASALQLAPSPP